MSQHTRREFLENSMFAAAAAAAAGQVALPRASAETESTSPNERLRIAILGVNGRGQSHMSAFLNRKDCEIVAIVDPDEAIGNKKGVGRVEKTTGKKPDVYQDLRRVMEDQSIDIVSIATPNHWHSLAAIWAIQSGKDVYVEKPVSHNVSEGRRIVEAAAKHGQICQAGTQCRTMKGTVDGIDFIKAGKIGEVKLARGLCYKPRGSIGPRGNYDVPASVDYSLWLGPAPEAPLTRSRFHYDWHWQWPYGNGDLGNQGIHQMDISRWGLGVDTIGDSVVSYGGRLGYEDAGDSANTQVSIHTFGDKTLVFETRGLKTGELLPTDKGKTLGAKIGVIFYGSDGYVVLDRYNHGAAFDLDGNMIQEFRGGRDQDHYDNFLACVRSRKAEDLNGHILEGHLSSALCHLGNISYRLGEQVSFAEAGKRLEGRGDEALETFERTKTHLANNDVDVSSAKLGFGLQLPIDGENETFTGEHADKANPMLTRQYRAPFVVPESKDV